MEEKTRPEDRQWSSFEKWISYTASVLKNMFPRIGVEKEDVEQDLRIELFKMWDRSDSNNSLRKWAYLKVKRKYSLKRVEHFNQNEDSVLESKFQVDHKRKD